MSEVDYEYKYLFYILTLMCLPLEEAIDYGPALSKEEFIEAYKNKEYSRILIKGE